MKCPTSKIDDLQSIHIGNVIVDSCPECKGFWFDNDELRKVKDIKINDANWFDIDLWKDESKFSGVKSSKVCPKCANALYKINYGGSDVEIDVCKNCKGIWLDRGEFEKILKYVKGESAGEILNNYKNNLIKEGKEIFTGPENVKSEVADLLMLIDFFKYKFMTQNEKLGNLLINLPIL